MSHLAQLITEMAFSKGYRDFVVEQLERITPLTARSMFGGVSLYTQGLFFALIAEVRANLLVLLAVMIYAAAVMLPRRIESDFPGGPPGHDFGPSPVAAVGGY